MAINLGRSWSQSACLLSLTSTPDDKITKRGERGEKGTRYGGTDHGRGRSRKYDGWTLDIGRGTA